MNVTLDKEWQSERRFSTRRYIFHDTMFRSSFYLKDWKWRKVRISEGALSGQLFHPAKGGGSLWIVGIQSPTVSTYYSAYLSLLNWLLPLLGERRQFSLFLPTISTTYRRSFLYLVRICTLNSICPLICLSDSPLKKIVRDLGEGKHDSTSCRVIKEQRSFVRNWNSIAGISRHLSLSLSCEKRNKKKQGIPKHFYASTCTRESRIPRSKDRPLRTHFVKTLTTEFQFLSSPFTSSYRVWPGKQSCCSKNIRIRAVRSIINIYMHSVNFCLFKIVLKIFKTRSFINQVFTNKRD